MSGYSLENAMFQWEDGRRRLREAELSVQARRAGEDIIFEVREQLRRRLGASFDAADLAALYGSGRDWADDIAYRLGEDLDDAQAAVDAAFWEHLRLARDFAGGVRINLDEDVGD